MIFEQQVLNAANPLMTTLSDTSVLPITVSPGLSDGLNALQPNLSASSSSGAASVNVSLDDLKGAKNLGGSDGYIGSPSARLRGAIGGQSGNGQDQHDFYKLKVSNNNISVALTGLKHNVNIRLLDSQGHEITRSTNSGTAGEIINLDVSSLNSSNPSFNLDTSNDDSNTYYVDVYQDTPAETPYDIQASNNQPSNLLVPEKFINNLSGTKSFSGEISNLNTSDIYQFSLDRTSNISVLLSGISTDQDIGVRLLRDRNGDGVYGIDEQIYSNLAPASSLDGSVSSLFAGLGSGTYLLQVYPNGSGNASHYQLELNAAAGAGIAPEPNNSWDKAFDIGTLNAPRGFTGSIDSRGFNPNIADYYQFTASSTSGSSTSTLKLSLDGLSANVDVALLDNSGNPIWSSNNQGNASESIQQELTSGNIYYIEVFAGNSTTPVISNYNLTLSM